MPDLTLDEWINEHWRENGSCYDSEIEDLIAREAGWRQVNFVSDVARELGLDVTVPSTHRSKSLLLPVYKITVPTRDSQWGFTVYARENFHGWVVTVKLEYAPCLPAEVVHSPLMKDYATSGDYPAFGCFAPYYAEGFDQSWCYRAPGRGTTHGFTTRLAFERQLYLLLYNLRHSRD